MELRHLRYIAAVAEHGSIAAASRVLHVSQSAISEQIADLESEIGGRLLHRGQRRVRLTPQGELFLAEAQKTLQAADRAVDIARRSLAGQVGTLSIGFFVWGVGSFFPRLIREYRRLHPEVRLRLHDMIASHQLDALATGAIDVGFTRPLAPPYDRTLKSELLYRDPIVAVMPREHPLAGGPIRVEQLAGEPFVLCERAASPVIYDGIMALCARAGFVPNIVNTSMTWYGVLTLAEAGEGIGLVPYGTRRLRTDGLVLRTLAPAAFDVGLSIAWNPINEGALVRDFLQLVREHKERILRTAGE
jgi:DNA-binding transcriptional LysR family regulator